MKKIFYILSVAAVAFGFASCTPYTDEEPGGTAVESMAGEWLVHNELLYTENGETTNYGDYYGYGDFIFRTYNTAANVSNELFIFEDSFWGVKAKCSCDLENNTIYADRVITEQGDTVKVSGKIIKNGCLNLHGKPNDSICVDVTFTSDPDYTYRYSGSRYTGFYE